MAADGEGAGLPIPMGVRANGQPRPALTPEELLRQVEGAAGDTDEVLARGQAGKVLGVAGNVDDPMDLRETGWAVLFASDADPRIHQQLQPLLDLRRKQVQDEKLFRIFEGREGVFPGQPADNWARQRGVSLTAAVDPRKGVPYYLLIVGSPREIPFEFQALLKLQWAVGRLYFDDIKDYGRYAQAVVDYEAPDFRPVQRRSAAAWVTKHDGDAATTMLSNAVYGDFVGGDDPLGERRQFSLEWFGDGEATKEQLAEILRGKAPSGPPAILFTGSHGGEWPMDDPAAQRQMQGALVTQEFNRGTPLGAANVFSAGDVPADAQVHGMMAFMFACYSGGCPTEDNYFFNKDGSKIPVAPEALIAKLPQKLLSRGALAVIAHIDQAFSYIFQNLEGTPQVQSIRTPLELLMKGERAGLAADRLNLQWSAIAAQVGVALGRRREPNFDPESFATLYIARDDARNYIVLGDPATRLRVKDLQ
jgi:hypothetical protein